MEKCEAYEKIKAKREKSEKRNKVILALLVVLAIGGVAGYFGYQYYLTQKGISDGYISPEPTLPPIEQKTFEELPVGVIYEVPEELQEQYLKAAKAKYEKYKDLGSQQEMTVNHPGNFLEKREDVTPRRNEKPSDMLNDDMSLRYPDMFYGFVIHNQEKTQEGEDWFFEVPLRLFKEENTASNKMNQILFIEDYYKNNGKIGEFYQNRGGFDKEYFNGITDSSLSKYPYLTTVELAINSGLIKLSKDQGILKTLFTTMYFPSLGYTGEDQYDIAKRIMYNHTTEHFKEADNVKGFIDKYNARDELPDTYPIFFYPTKVWKIDEKTIVVDIQVDGARGMNMFDTFEMLTKLVQANLTTITEEYEVYEYPEYNKDNTYLVMGRFFNSDLTQGILPDLGYYPINYFGLDSTFIGDSSFLKGNFYVFNEKAEGFLRDYYSILKEKLENNEMPSTREMLKQAAKENNISYNDAMEIFITHYLQATKFGDSGTVDWN